MLGLDHDTIDQRAEDLATHGPIGLVEVGVDRICKAVQAGERFSQGVLLAGLCLQCFSLGFELRESFSCVLHSRFELFASDDPIRVSVDQSIHRSLLAGDLLVQGRLTLGTIWRSQASFVFLAQQFRITDFLALGPLACAAFAAPPQLVEITPRGFAVGKNLVTVQATGLTPATRLVLDVPGVTATPIKAEKPTPNVQQYEVVVAPATQHGIFLARVANEQGASEALPYMVDALADQPAMPGNNDPAKAQELKVPGAALGRLSSSQSDWYAFDGHRGQKLVMEVFSRRLGSASRSVIHLCKADRLELSWAQGSRLLGGDSRLVAELPADGRYLIEVHELVYRGDGKPYRLVIGDMQFAEAMYPLGAARGSNPVVTYLGGNVGESKPTPFAMTEASSTGLIGIVPPLMIPPTAVNKAPIASAAPLRFAVGRFPEAMEVATPAATAAPQVVSNPGVMNGRIAQPGEKDVYQVAVVPKSRLRFHIQAEQLGSPLDAVLELRSVPAANATGAAATAAVLATADDSPQSADPDLQYVVPDAVTSLTVAISDAGGNGSKLHAYRLIVEPGGTGDFDIAFSSATVNVPAGGNTSLPITVTRRGYLGPIRLKPVGTLPAGVKVDGLEIGAGVNSALVSFSCAAGASLDVRRIGFVAEAGPTAAPTHSRPVTTAVQPYHEGLPWLRGEVTIAVAQPAPLNFALEATSPVLVRGKDYAVKVKVARTAGMTGPVTLAAKFAQNNQGGQVAAVANQKIEENAAEGLFKFTVPINAIDSTIGITFTGTLLDAKDKKTTVATVESPVLYSRVVFPFMFETQDLPLLKRGARQVVSLKVTRYADFKQSITATLSGVPGTLRIQAPPTNTLTIAADASTLELPIFVAPTQPVGPIANVRILAIGQATPPLTATPLEIPFVVAEADPVPFIELFDEDDPTLLFVEGAGAITADRTKPYSGKLALTLANDQKARTTLPAVTLPIAENPMPGQYRYLRYAWRKQGAGTISLTIANSNRLGGASPKGAELRYVAGPEKQDTIKPENRAIKIADSAPGEWTIVTRDLFADFGPITITGLGLSTKEGQAASLDYVFLARSEKDFPPPAAK